MSEEKLLFDRIREELEAERKQEENKRDELAARFNLPPSESNWDKLRKLRREQDDQN